VSGRRALGRLAILLALLLAGALVASAVALYHGQREWSARLADARAAREDLGRRLTATDVRLGALRGELAGAAAALREREARLEVLARRMESVEKRIDAGERLLPAAAGGVALIAATLRYEDAAGRPLRYRGVEARRPWRGVLGPPPIGVDGEGNVVTTTFLGTGFLVRRDGTILTSRHVVRPLETENEMDALRELGVEPRLVTLRAFFPGLVEPIPLIQVGASDAADLMLLSAVLPPGAVPVLPLDTGATMPGREVIVLGYPGGLELLLARVEPRILRTLVPDGVQDIADDTVDVPRLLAELARRRLIRPHASWGHVVEVQPHRITYDGRTMIGASGGPILSSAGRVVGVQQAVLLDADGVAFGIPIRHGLALLQGHGPRP
jgi:S1-C subfamily serine protease